MRAAQRRLIPNRYHGNAVGRRRRRRGARRARWLPAVVAAATVALAGTVLALSIETAELLAGSDWLCVRGVEVHGHRQLTAAQVLDWIGQVDGQPLLELDPAAIVDRLRSHPRIADARAARGIDRRLHLEIEERQPVALVLAGVLAEIDADGVVLPPIDGVPLPDRPVLTGAVDRTPAPGERLGGPTLRRALGLCRTLAARDPSLLMRIAEIDLSGDPVLSLRLTGGGVVLRTHVDSLTPEKLDGLHAVLEDLERRGRRGVEIDLRFEGQLVVRPAPGAPSGAAAPAPPERGGGR